MGASLSEILFDPNVAPFRIPAKGADARRHRGEKSRQRGSFAARISTFSIVGALTSNSGALAVSAAATRPARCAWRPASSGNESKMPNVDGPSLIAYQVIVAGSCSTIGRPSRRKLATAASFPGFASRRTRRAARTVVVAGLVALGMRFSFEVWEVAERKPLADAVTVPSEALGRGSPKRVLLGAVCRQPRQILRAIRGADQFLLRRGQTPGG